MKNENLKSKSSCEQAKLLIDEYLEGMISLQDKEMMDEHLSGCESCSAYEKETSALIKKLSSLPSDNVSLPVHKKNDLWSKVASGIDLLKYKKEKSEKIKIASLENKSTPDFFSKYKVFLSGIAAVLVIGFIVFGVKNMNLKNDRLALQDTYGIGTYWKVSNIKGTSLIGDAAMSFKDSIKEGQFIKTNDSSSANLIIANIGNVIIEPNSKVIFVKGADGNNRILVEYGTINTKTNSNSKTFFVEMPNAVATDNGGAYTLTIDSTGNGLVYVKSGKVEVESPNREAIVPAGNLVFTKKDIGVGTPFNENTSDKFKNALLNFDFGKCTGSCVNTLLNAAKMSDAVTLVNLIPNVEQEYKDEVYAKVANFVSPPGHIHHDSISFIDEEKLNDWIDKIQIEVQANVERSMKEVEKNLEQLKNIDQFNPDTLKALEDFAKNWKFKIQTGPKGNYEWGEDSTNFDKEKFKEDMEDMKENLGYDKEQLKEDMEDLKENLKDMKENMKENLNLNNEELKKEMEKVKEEIQKAVKEVQKNSKIKIYETPGDTTHYKIRMKTENGFENKEDVEQPEKQETPVVPEPKVKDDDK